MDTPTQPDRNEGDLWSGALSDHRARQAHHIAGAAMGIIASDGVAGLSMSAIAKAAAISRQTLYKYFPDVDAVLLGLATMAGEMDARLADDMAAQDPGAALDLFVRYVLEAAAAGHPSPLLLGSALPNRERDAIAEHAQRAEVLVIDVLRRGVAAGSFRADLDSVLDGRIVYRLVLASHDLAAEPGADIEGLVSHVGAAVGRVVAD